VPLRLPALEQLPGGSLFAALSRRVRTLIVGGVLFLILFILALTMPVPYVILSPGPTFNTLGVDGNGNKIITLVGRKPHAVSGNLNMTTVNVSTSSVSAFQAFAGWLAHDQVVVPRSAVYPPSESRQQVDQQNTQAFKAALCELGYPKGYGVYDVEPKSPSAGLLQPGDRLVSLGGTPVGSADALRAVLAQDRPGQTVVVQVVRGGTRIDVPIKLGTSPADHKTAYMGILSDVTCLAPFTVKIGLNDQIGGPSAGLMFALGIIDQAGTTDLTHGRFIAGTGEISAAGKVGAIGGIALKMIAARHKGATVFLAPSDNCSDVKGNIPSGLKVLSVGTLHQAVTDLEKLAAGDTNLAGC
jgi:PDZ domain-containing protein